MKPLTAADPRAARQADDVDEIGAIFPLFCDVRLRGDMRKTQLDKGETSMEMALNSLDAHLNLNDPLF